jgi:hypothetical protein
MLKQFEITAVIVVITITIAAQALLALWSQNLTYAGTPLSPPVEPLVAWTLNGLALLAAILIVGPKHERIWLIALLFLVVTVIGSFYVSQFVLGVYKYRRDYTCVPIDSGLLLQNLLRQDVDSSTQRRGNLNRTGFSTQRLV